MVEFLMAALGTYGPWALIAAILAWRIPAVVRETLYLKRLGNDARCAHERNLTRFRCELEERKSADTEVSSIAQP